LGFFWEISAIKGGQFDPARAGQFDPAMGGQIVPAGLSQTILIMCCLKSPSIGN
jgi:hypothetical protein